MDIKQNLILSKQALQPGLYLVSTPIGNLGDITIRALETLTSVSCIVCEDTRVTSKLLKHYGINNKLYTYNDHSDQEIRDKIIERVSCGEAVALVSDAGTPLISDPGYKLVRDIKAKGQNVFTIPGASAAISAVTVSGLPTDRFMFCGFLSSKKISRKNELKELATVNTTLIFYESATRLKSVLEDIKECFGEAREIVVARELTKRFEEVKSGTAEELINSFNEENLRGEIVLLISPIGEQKIDQNKIDDEIRRKLKNNSIKDISNSIHEEYGVSKKQIYDRALELRNAIGKEED